MRAEADGSHCRLAETPGQSIGPGEIGSCPHQHESDEPVVAGSSDILWYPEW